MVIVYSVSKYCKFFGVPDCEVLYIYLYMSKKTKKNNGHHLPQIWNQRLLQTIIHQLQRDCEEQKQNQRKKEKNHFHTKLTNNTPKKPSQNIGNRSPSIHSLPNQTPNVLYYWKILSKSPSKSGHNIKKRKYIKKNTWNAHIT